MHKYIYLFIILFIYPLLGDDSASCYSIQLQSSKEKILQISKFPAECQAMEIASYNAIRCGCYSSATDAKTSLEHYKTKYPKAILVQTYKYRFIPNKETKIEKEKEWSSLASLLYQEITFANSSQAFNEQKYFQTSMKQEFLQNQTKREKLLSKESNFYGLSLQGKYEQYLNQNYRFREYTDYEYDLKLQFDLFKGGYFGHKKENVIKTKKEQIRYIQNLSNILKNNYDEQLLMINAVVSELNYKYFFRLQTLYKEALQHKMNDYSTSLSTQNEVEELQQILNRFTKSAEIYKAHQNTAIHQETYQLLTRIEHLKLQEYDTILKYAKENNVDIQLQKAHLSLLDEAPSYSDEIKINLYGHRRVVDEMGWYNTLGVEAKLPLDFTSHEKAKVVALEQVSSAITQKSYDNITASKLLQLFQNFSDIQKLIAIDRDDIIFLQRRVKRYEIIEKNTIPNLNYKPEDKILQLSQNIIELEFQIAIKRVELFKTLCNIAYLSNTSDSSYLIKGLK